MRWFVGILRFAQNDRIWLLKVSGVCVIDIESRTAGRLPGRSVVGWF
jgi:hypothetical protein